MTSGCIIIAHPDDDALFAGAYQRAHPWINWTVVCVTYLSDDERAKELADWQRRRRAEEVIHLGFHDDRNDIKTGVSSFSSQEVYLELKKIKRRFDVILTHNHIGEYGHPHHIVVHRAVRRRYRKRVLCFAAFTEVEDIAITLPDFVDEVCASFPSQEQIIRKYHGILDCCHVGRYLYMDTIKALE